MLKHLPFALAPASRRRPPPSLSPDALTEEEGAGGDGRRVSGREGQTEADWHAAASAGPETVRQDMSGMPAQSLDASGGQTGGTGKKNLLEWKHSRRRRPDPPASASADVTPPLKADEGGGAAPPEPECPGTAGSALSGADASSERAQRYLAGDTFSRRPSQESAGVGAAAPSAGGGGGGGGGQGSKEERAREKRVGKWKRPSTQEKAVEHNVGNVARLCQHTWACCVSVHRRVM